MKPYHLYPTFHKEARAEEHKQDPSGKWVPTPGERGGVGRTKGWSKDVDTAWEKAERQYGRIRSWRPGPVGDDPDDWDLLGLTGKEQVQYVPIDTLVPSEGEPEDVSRKVRALQKRPGKEVPVVVERIRGGKWEIQDGHHRWGAAKKLGYTHVPVFVMQQETEVVSRA